LFLPAIAGTPLGVVGGVGGSLLAAFIQKFFDRRETSPTLPDINGDLLNLVANAIAREIADFSRDPQALLDEATQRDVLAFANTVAPAFEHLVHSEELPDIAPPDVK